VQSPKIDHNRFSIMCKNMGWGGWGGVGWGWVWWGGVESLNGPIPIKSYKREVPIYTCVYREIHLSGLRSHCVIVPVIVHCNQLYIAMEEAVSPTIEPKKSIN
jgi:hypothetical protein